jgi:hypothetical protein
MSGYTNYPIPAHPLKIKFVNKSEVKPKKNEVGVSFLW